MRKFLTGLALASLAVSAFAQESGGSTIDLTAASTAATNISTAIAGLLTGAVLTGLLAVYGGRITLWVIGRIANWVGAGKK